VQKINLLLDIMKAPILFGILVLILLAAFAKSIVIRIEAFDNTGALMQLSATHVPTEEDVLAAAEERRQIKKELIDLTGSE
jgi:hypothetical protein